MKNLILNLKPLDKLKNLCYNIITVKIKLKSVERKQNYDKERISERSYR